MSLRVVRGCLFIGCPNYAENGAYCRVHRTVPERRRGSRSQRGYDRAWYKLRAALLGTDPLCEDCKAEGYWVEATDGHHEQPIAEAPELRLDPSNIKRLCKYHHAKREQAKRTARFATGA